MPLITIGLLQQQQAASSGVNAYPQIGQIKKDTVIIDEFTRETLNPTNALAVYTIASNDSNGTAVISLGRLLLLTTDSSAIGDDVNVRTSELGFERIPETEFIDGRTTIKFIIDFNVVTTTNTEGFIGVLNAQTSIAALPTTARHLGLFWDLSVSDNYFLTSANGTDQTTTDTGVAVSTTRRRLEISWTGNNTGIITFFEEENDSIAQTIQTVTTLNMTARNFEWHFFLQTEAAAAKTLNIHEWRVDAS